MTGRERSRSARPARPACPPGRHCRKPCTTAASGIPRVTSATIGWSSTRPQSAASPGVFAGTNATGYTLISLAFHFVREPSIKCITAQDAGTRQDRPKDQGAHHDHL